MTKLIFLYEHHYRIENQLKVILFSYLVKDKTMFMSTTSSGIKKDLMPVVFNKFLTMEGWLDYDVDELPDEHMENNLNNKSDLIFYVESKPATGIAGEKKIKLKPKVCLQTYLSYKHCITAYLHTCV